MIRLVQEAQGSKPAIAKQADRIAAYFVPIVLGIALCSFLGWWIWGPAPTLPHAILAAVSVLIVACPCAIGLATPTAVIVGIGRAAQMGILIRHGEALEKGAAIDTVIFDKTGTLTKGKLSVTHMSSRMGSFVTQWMNGHNRALLFYAATVESGSEHPVGRAILEEAEKQGVPLSVPTQFNAYPGQGIRANIDQQTVHVGTAGWLEQEGIRCAEFESEADRAAQEGKTSVYVAIDRICRGIIVLSDTLKDEAVGTAGGEGIISRLRRMGLAVYMITGDRKAVANAVAKQLSIHNVMAEVLPHEKADRVKALQGAGARVAMAGDGINDAPALSQADLGIAMSTGTDMAMAASDITLVGGNLNGIPAALSICRKTVRNIKQNLFFAFVYNLILIPVAAGIFYPHVVLSPTLAALAMALSSICVITNALRLRTVVLS